MPRRPPLEKGPEETREAPLPGVAGPGPFPGGDAGTGPDVLKRRVGRLRDRRRVEKF